MKSSTINKKEIEKFSKMASEWWNPLGKFKPLHKFNPIRIKYIRDSAAKHFKIPLNLTIISYLQSFAFNLINVCIKHIPIGQKVGQDCIIQTYDLIRELEKDSENLNLEDLGGICFNSDIYSIKHENLKTRVYKT